MLKHSKKVFITGLVSSSLLLAPALVSAASSNTVITATIGSTISMSSSGAVAINVTPAVGGAQTSASDTVSVSTNNTTGYTLTLADSDATTTLVNGANSIAASAATQAASAVLANNTWGYHVDGVGNMATGGAVETNVGSSSIKYAGVPATGAANTIKATAAVAVSDATTFWYAVKADTSKPNGNYIDTVTYTATTNP